MLAASLPSGSRILDVGCGDGGLVDRLNHLGFDAFGVDPIAPTHPRLTQERIEQAAGLEGFDAVTAVMALHRADLDVASLALSKALRPGGWLFLYEYGWDAYNEQAAGWILKHESSPPDTTIAGWRREHCQLHTISTMRQALSARFNPTLEVRRPYLARMLSRQHLEAEEYALIDTQHLPALGLWYIARLNDDCSAIGIRNSQPHDRFSPREGDST